MPPRASLKTFLATARAALTAQSSKRATPLTFVVGNESADLDSLCSALLLAYFNTYAPPKRRASIGEGSLASNTLHIPVCHLLRADLALRPEFTAVLRDAGVKGEDVFTLEDVLPHENGVSQSDNTEDSTHRPSSGTTTKGMNPEDTHWLLVDHNAMTGSLANTFASRVTGCVDHHADENTIPRDAQPRVIEKSGSCASLVLEHCAEIWEALSPDETTDGNRNTSGNDEDDAKKVDAQIARLALAPILIDTINLGDKNKTTEHDERAVALAEGKIAAAVEGGGGEKYDREAFFKRLAELKEDIADMSFRDVFRKDYKEWSVAGLDLGTSSVPRGFGYLVDEKAKGDKGVFVKALVDWGKEKDVLDLEDKMDVVMLLTAFQDENEVFHRELLVWGRSEMGVRAAKLFEEKYAGELRLESWGDGALDEDGEGEWRRCWMQGAVQHSRKQIAPLLRDVLKEVAGR
ncbi:exopolyphosphatase-like protein [Xylaria bambusicola]|uniref:exopolyphosphatase-like protein n=1 Tax=Xylaria bambusicola TaxID=326684 RepID=UPI00200768AF|nr:exopolyphosphatase-like protein [Xylaria bambusicola]KAI0516877.1 exopolyphosphatase-like protein [Xylaria bambusicola]